MARCPAHDDQTASLSVSSGNDGRILLKCHAGCSAQQIVGAMGLTMRDLYLEQQPPSSGKRLVATYRYPSGAEKLRYQQPDGKKTFSWRHPDGKGGWIYNRRGVPHELYVAGELSGAVYVVEGEKDADTLHGIGCDAVSGADGAGPGKWRKEYTEQLRGLCVVVLMDNDDVGRAFAIETCAALYGAAESVYLIDPSTEWADMPEHGDITDYFNQFGADATAELLVKLSSTAEKWEPPAVLPESESKTAESLRPPDFSDAGNAEVFVRLAQNDLVYTGALGWLWWTGKQWEQDDQKATEFALDMTKSMLEEAKLKYLKALYRRNKANLEGEDSEEDAVKAKQEAKRAKDYFRHAQSARNAIRIRNFVELSKPALHKKAEIFDANPFDLNTPAGIVNLKDGTLRPHDRKAYCRQMTAVAPGQAGMERWIEFLDTVTCGNGGLKGFLQQLSGMSLIGAVYQEGIFMAYGGGRNGKSTFFNALGAVFGDYSGGIDVKTITADRTNKGAALATLRGKRLVVTGELEEHQRLSVATLKQLASTDKITVEEKFRQPETITPSHTLVLFTNFLPRVGSTDSGTWRRLIVVPFEAVIPANQSVQNYGDVLAKEAGGAILSWAIEGASDFIRNGFKLDIPDVVAEAMETYRAREDWLTSFIEECCIQEPNARVDASTLYSVYRDWAKATESYVRRPNDFIDAMQTAGYERIRPRNIKKWVGIRINQDSPYSGASSYYAKARSL